VTFTFRPAVRMNVPLLIGLAGGTGSGKTYTALTLARGLAGGKPFAGIDTENGRMLIYADEFPELQHGEIEAPFRPEKYADAVEAADKQGFPVIVVDSASHEWYGDGGCLDWQEALMRGDESRRLMSWIEPKKAHKRMVTRLLQVNAHVILCFRAEPKVEMIDDPQRPGKKKFVEKRSITGLDGWIPIAEKNLPYELTASFLLMADKPGVPRPIKLPEKLRGFFPLDRPIGEHAGVDLARWAAGAVDDTAGLSMDDFRAKIAERQVDQELLGAVGKRLFPEARNASALTNEQREQVWKEIEHELAGAAA